MNKNIKLYIPKLEDYWYQEKLQNDPKTMEYNKGYEEDYYGYDYETGCISFPKEKWEEMYNKRIKENRYYAYILDIDLDKFIGEVNYQYNKYDDRYYCGIVIESTYRKMGYSKLVLNLLCETAKENGIKSLYDSFEEDRVDALNLFTSIGFKVVEQNKTIKNKKEVNLLVVSKDL